MNPCRAGQTTLRGNTMKTPVHINNVAVLASCQALYNSGRTLTFLSAVLSGANMLGDDQRLATLPITMMIIGMASGTIPAAQVMHKIGRKWGFFLGSMIGTLGSFICVVGLLVDNFFLFNLGMFVYGLYSAAAQQYRFAATDVAPENFKAKAISLVIAAGVVGAFVGPWTTGLTKDLLIGAEFAGAFCALSAFTLAAGLIILWVDIPLKTEQKGSDTGRPLLLILTQPTAVVAIISATFSYVIMNLLMVATPLAMRIGYQHLFFDTQLVLMLHVVGMFAPGFFTGNLINRFGTINIVLAGTLLQIIAICVALSGTGVTFFWVSLLLLGIGWNFSFTAGTRLLTQVHTPAEQGKVQGTNDFIVFTGMAISSIFSGTLYHFFGWQWVNMAAIPMALLIIASAVWLIFVKRTNNPSTIT